jgi:hypothetical protein
MSRNFPNTKIGNARVSYIVALPLNHCCSGKVSVHFVIFYFLIKYTILERGGGIKRKMYSEFF